METIITLLIILIPIIFKAIGKKLEQASASQSSQEEQPIEDWAETLRRHLEAQNVLVEEPSQRAETKPDQQADVKPKKTAPVVAAKPQVQKVAPKLEEPLKKEKLDPKKLIVYSEIMKPKYTEE